ncbi:cytochrome P450 71D8-like [Arachis stenosperma]|uniref:cytochrome P450 71D8-like n=1 Tax=Arachis stenosperma TaxID=217475 RepID=UPI0025AC71EF|nr:cytochrome P450 71D8-like [Arachis stenosperma]
MEVSSSMVFIIISFLISLLLLWHAKKGKSVQKVPPGPWKLPLIGNLHQLAGSSLPHHALRKLANKHGPFMHLQLGQISAVIVSSPNMAREIMKTHDLAFADRPEFLPSKILVYGSADITFSPYGEYWRQMRKICTLELLSSKKVHSFSFIREEEVANMVETIRKSTGATINLSKMINNHMSTVVSRAMFGNISEDHEQFVSFVKEAIAVADGFDIADLFPSLKPLHFITGFEAKLKKMHVKIDKILEKIIKENESRKLEDRHQEQEEKNENLVEVLLRILHNGTLSTLSKNNVKAVIWDIFAGGTDTSGVVIEWVMSELMRSPRAMKKAQAEIQQALKEKQTIREEDVTKLPYLKAVISETMRLHPPVPLLLPRQSREECTIHGYHIPIKTKVMVNAYALGRDPDYWYDAETFLPERFQESPMDFKGTNFEYIPFGAGRRICPGLNFGLANVEFALAMLLYHFNWELPNGIKPEDLDMNEAQGAVVGRKNHLYLIPTPYHH